MRFAQVLEDGSLVQAPSRVLAYNTMMHIRAMILLDGVNCISKAAVIATRYAAVRRQSPIDPNQGEPQIIDHVTQQYKLFPNIARSVVFKILFNSIWQLFEKVCAEVNEFDLSHLPEVAREDRRSSICTHILMWNFVFITAVARHIVLLQTVRNGRGGNGCGTITFVVRRTRIHGFGEFHVHLR